MKINNKAMRKIDHSLGRMYNGIGPVKFSKEAEDSRDALARMIQLSRHRILEFTEAGFSEFRDIVKNIHSMQILGQDASYSDIWGATKSVIESLLSEDKRPDDGSELVQLVREKIAPDVIKRSFAISVYGIHLEANQPVKLGDFTLIPPTMESLRAVGLPVDIEHLPNSKDNPVSRSIANLGQDPLIVGQVTGTSEVAEARFRSRAELLMGLLAVFVGANYENGATGFRFGIRYSSETALGKATYFSWTEHSEEATVHMVFASGQLLKLNDFEEKLFDQGLFERGIRAIEMESRNELEEAMVKALYWFWDAQRDVVPVMQFVKYWSCVETFFSTKESVVRSVSTGLATVLVAGGGDFFRPDEYVSLKRRITKLYAMRCRALHGASYQHVTSRDVADMSQWTAWMLLIMTSLLQRGYSSPESVKFQTERLDAILMRGVTAQHPTSDEASESA
ncbi:hypothetical protein LL967_12930 [Xanthomonas campestris pv. zinniae]|uniref:hypothetical protein n=1 Tax=Xanthomonas cannabis TaxID=1885674 RepID=UPI001E577B2E|nr:hypothetical protein [Xanthomonas campestris pv. zinniae]